MFPGVSVSTNQTSFDQIKSSCLLNDDPLIRQLGWNKLDNQRKFHKAVMVHKSLHGLALGYLCSMFTDRSSITSYSLRDTEGKLTIPKPRTDYLKNSFSYSGAVLWNSLPMDLRQANTLSKFRRGYSNLFLD